MAATCCTIRTRAAFPGAASCSISPDARRLRKSGVKLPSAVTGCVRCHENDAGRFFVGIERESQLVQQIFVGRQTMQIVDDEQFACAEAATEVDNRILVHRLNELLAEVLSGDIVGGFFAVRLLPMADQSATQVRLARAARTE